MQNIVYMRSTLRIVKLAVRTAYDRFFKFHHRRNPILSIKIRYFKRSQFVNVQMAHLTQTTTPNIYLNGCCFFLLQIHIVVGKESKIQAHSLIIISVLSSVARSSAAQCCSCRVIVCNYRLLYRSNIYIYICEQQRTKPKR